jgi:hypothetical protein
MADIEPDDTQFLLLRTAAADDVAAATALLDSASSDRSELWVFVDPADYPDTRIHGAAETRPSGPDAVELARFATRPSGPPTERHMLAALANVLRRRGCRSVIVHLQPEQTTRRQLLQSLGWRPVGPESSVSRWLLEL